MWSPFIVGITLVTAALFEVAGDAVVRKGLRGSGLMIVAVGFAMLGTYGVIVNLLAWDFSKLLGVYVAVFATAAVLFGRFLFREVIPVSTWLGLAIIILGALIIQFGQSSGR